MTKIDFIHFSEYTKDRADIVFIYALGRSLPVVVAGTFAGTRRSLRGIGSWSARIEQASGVVILGVGLFLIWSA